jgi:hypothetical protein
MSFGGAGTEQSDAHRAAIGVRVSNGAVPHRRRVIAAVLSDGRPFPREYIELTPDDIEEIRIDVESAGKPALSMMLHRDGTLGRQGSGAVPMNDPPVLGMTDGRFFQHVSQVIDERVFPHAGVYDYPQKIGTPVSYTVVFLGPTAGDNVNRESIGFKVAVGTENDDVHAIVKYVDTLVSHAVSCTQEFYDAAKNGKTGKDLPGGV